MRLRYPLAVLAVLLGATAFYACTPPETAAVKATKAVHFRLSEVQIKAIQEAGDRAVVTGYLDSTLWLQVNGSAPLNEAHICPPWTDC